MNKVRNLCSATRTSPSGLVSCARCHALYPWWLSADCDKINGTVWRLCPDCVLLNLSEGKMWVNPFYHGLEGSSDMLRWKKKAPAHHHDSGREEVKGD